MSKYIFFCKITFNKINLICYSEELHKVIHIVEQEIDYLNYESRYIFSNKDFLNEFVFFINEFEKRYSLFVSNMYLVFEESFIQTIGINIFSENIDNIRISFIDYEKLKKKAVDFWNKKKMNDYSLISVLPFETNIDDVKISFGKKAKGKKLAGNFYILSILKIILDKIDVSFAKMKIHIEDIFSAEVLQNFYIKTFLREDRESFNNSLFIKINTNETIFYLTNDKNDVFYKNSIKKGIFDIIKIISKELDIVEFSVILECLNKLNEIQENEIVEYFTIEKEQIKFKIEVSRIAQLLYNNIVEILMKIKEHIEQNNFQIEKIFLLRFEFNQNFLMKIISDIFQKNTEEIFIDNNYKKNIINNSRIFDSLKKNQNFNDLIIAIDFYKKIINTNLVNSDYSFNSNKITCFLKSFFY